VSVIPQDLTHSQVCPALYIYLNSKNSSLPGVSGSTDPLGSSPSWLMQRCRARLRTTTRQSPGLRLLRADSRGHQRPQQRAVSSSIMRSLSIREGILPVCEVLLPLCLLLQIEDDRLGGLPGSALRSVLKTLAASTCRLFVHPTNIE